jgi:outer membrane protein assembly factor BamE (lipoprotein component of BamABCDE complex)
VLLAAAAVADAPVLGAGMGQNVEQGSGAAPAAARQARNFSEQTLAKVVPGHTTKAEVESLLGRPWRKTELDEEDLPYPGDPSVEVWEYRGRDPHGTYRVHIEFDKNAVTTLIARIPDKAAHAVARVAKPTPDPAQR